MWVPLTSSHSSHSIATLCRASPTYGRPKSVQDGPSHVTAASVRPRPRFEPRPIAQTKHGPGVLNQDFTHVVPIEVHKAKRASQPCGRLLYGLWHSPTASSRASRYASRHRSRLCTDQHLPKGTITIGTSVRNAYTIHCEMYLTTYTSTFRVTQKKREVNLNDPDELQHKPPHYKNS